MGGSGMPLVGAGLVDEPVRDGKLRGKRAVSDRQQIFAVDHQRRHARQPDRFRQGVAARLEGFSDAAVASSDALLAGFEDNLEDELISLNGINEDEETWLQEKNQALASNVLSSLAIWQRARSTCLNPWTRQTR